MRSNADPEADGWRAGRFGPDVPATERAIPYDGRERLAWYRAKREGERVRALLAGDRPEERARGFFLGGR